MSERERGMEQDQEKASCLTDTTMAESPIPLVRLSLLPEAPREID